MSTVASTGGGAPASTDGGAPQSTAGGSPGSTAGTAFAWPADWRKQLAGADEQELKRLERFQDPSTIYRSFREFETRQSKGELKSVLPKDATTEQTARWRQENGIPAKPEEYKLTLPEGRPAPKDDDKFLAATREMAHKNNYSQAQFDALIGNFYAQVDASEDYLDQQEQQAIERTKVDLAAKWGADAQTNFNLIENLVARSPDGVGKMVMDGYIEDPKLGRIPFRASPAAMNWLVGLERELNPASTVVPGAGTNLAKSVDDEIREIEAFMRKDRPAYNKDEKKQARLRELYEARDKLKARAA